MRWQSIVFDLDDTLYPEREYVFSGFQAVSMWMDTYFNIPQNRGLSELIQLHHDGIRGNLFDHWLNRYDLVSVELINQLINVYREHSPNIHLFAEAESAIHEIHGRCKLGIISDGYISVQQKKIQALGIEHLFDAVILTDKWGRQHWKPSEKPFREALLLLETSAELTVYVGDNPLKDFHGARVCGWHTIWLKYPNGEYASKTPPSADYAPHVTVDTFSKLLEYLLR